MLPTKRGCRRGGFACSPISPHRTWLLHSTHRTTHAHTHFHLSNNSDPKTKTPSLSFLLATPTCLCTLSHSSPPLPSELSPFFCFAARPNRGPPIFHIYLDTSLSAAPAPLGGRRRAQHIALLPCLCGAACSAPSFHFPLFSFHFLEPNPHPIVVPHARSPAAGSAPAAACCRLFPAHFSLYLLVRPQPSNGARLAGDTLFSPIKRIGPLRGGRAAVQAPKAALLLALHQPAATLFFAVCPFHRCPIMSACHMQLHTSPCCVNVLTFSHTLNVLAGAPGSGELCVAGARWVRRAGDAHARRREAAAIDAARRLGRLTYGARAVTAKARTATPLPPCSLLSRSCGFNSTHSI